MINLYIKSLRFNRMNGHQLTQQSICPQLMEWHPIAIHTQGPPLVESNATHRPTDPVPKLITHEFNSTPKFGNIHVNSLIHFILQQKLYKINSLTAN